MEFGKVAITRPELKDLQKSPPSLHLFSEVILLDKSSANTCPLVYQLRDDMRPSFTNLQNLQNFSGHFEEAFVYAGDLLEHDTNKKIVRLSNEISYSYGRLITATTHMNSLEITTLLHALKNALLLETLRIQQKMTHEVNDSLGTFTHSNNQTHSYCLQMSYNTDQNALEKVAQPCLDFSSRTHYCPDIPSSSKTLCQVQL